MSSVERPSRDAGPQMSWSDPAFASWLRGRCVGAKCLCCGVCLLKRCADRPSSPPPASCQVHLRRHVDVMEVQWKRGIKPATPLSLSSAAWRSSSEARHQFRASCRLEPAEQRFKLSQPLLVCLFDLSPNWPHAKLRVNKWMEGRTAWASVGFIEP